MKLFKRRERIADEDWVPRGVEILNQTRDSVQALHAIDPAARFEIQSHVLLIRAVLVALGELDYQIGEPKSRKLRKAHRELHDALTAAGTALEALWRKDSVPHPDGYGSDCGIRSEPWKPIKQPATREAIERLIRVQVNEAASRLHVAGNYLNTFTAAS